MTNNEAVTGIGIRDTTLGFDTRYDVNKDMGYTT